MIDASPVKKKIRNAIAYNFIKLNENEIYSIPEFQKLSIIEIINKYSIYINEIYDSAIKIHSPLTSPYKEGYDSDYSTYRQNFFRGGMEIWIKKFSGIENKINTQYIFFCTKELYQDSMKYEEISYMRQYAVYKNNNGKIKTIKTGWNGITFFSFNYSIICFTWWRALYSKMFSLALFLFCLPIFSFLVVGDNIYMFLGINAIIHLAIGFRFNILLDKHITINDNYKFIDLVSANNSFHAISKVN